MAVNFDREKQELTRRNFNSFFAYSIYTVGILGALGQVGRFFWPNVQYGPPSKFVIGKPNLFPDGCKQNIADQKVSIIRHANQIGAISMVCQHLGCTVAASSTGYDCPCHGSKYDISGRVFKSMPAPKNLTVPPYAFASVARIIIGVDDAPKAV